MKMFKIFLPTVIILLTVVGFLYNIVKELAKVLEDLDFEDDDDLDIITTKE